MRISDWSSDVCSSDLNRGCVGPIDSLPGNFDHVLGDVHALRDHVEVRARRADDPQGRIKLDAGAATDGGDPDRGAVDRKSAVQGKSVSVRVDLGGRRINKQK